MLHWVLNGAPLNRAPIRRNFRIWRCTECLYCAQTTRMNFGIFVRFRHFVLLVSNNINIFDFVQVTTQYALFWMSRTVTEKRWNTNHKTSKSLAFVRIFCFCPQKKFITLINLIWGLFSAFHSGRRICIYTIEIYMSVCVCMRNLGALLNNCVNKVCSKNNLNAINTGEKRGQRKTMCNFLQNKKKMICCSLRVFVCLRLLYTGHNSQ